MSEFFDQLHEFSSRFVKAREGLDSPISPWGGESYGSGAPEGAIIHFTADEDIWRVARWFMKEKFQARASAHVIVGYERLKGHDKHAEGLPLIQALPVTVLQCRRPEMMAWHATWTNKFAYGIENVCAGELRTQDAVSFTSWRARDDVDGDGVKDPWTMPWNVGSKTPVLAFGRFWSPYPTAQVDANVTILRELRKMFPESLDARLILGHEAVQGVDTKGARKRDKRDPSPVFPMEGVRNAAFGDFDIDLYQWFEDFQNDPDYATTMRDQYVLDLMGSSIADAEAAWEQFAQEVRELRATDTDVFATGMRILGYADGSKTSVSVFQRMMGLTADGIVGPITCDALRTRLVDRGFLSS